MDAFDRTRDIELVMDALPEVIAVVEAAEYARNAARSKLDRELYRAHAPIALRRIGDRVDAALSALERKLVKGYA